MAPPLIAADSSGSREPSASIIDRAAVHFSSSPHEHTLYATGFHALTPTVFKEDDPHVMACRDESDAERLRGRVDSFPRELTVTGRTPHCKDAKRLASATVEALSWHWRDWMFVGSPGAMAKLADMSERHELVSASETRCYGLCQEEQTMLQMLRAGVRYAPLGIPVVLDRVACAGGSGQHMGSQQQSQMEPLAPTQPAWATPCFACHGKVQQSESEQ